MARVCELTGKKRMVGNNVSHAKNRTRRTFEPNLHSHRLWSEKQNKFIKLTLSNKGLRIVNKLGLDSALVKYGLK